LKLKFKQQAFQTEAVQAVADCFAGQPKGTGFRYAIDRGRVGPGEQLTITDDGFANARLALTPAQILENIQAVQRRQNLTVSSELKSTPICAVNLDVEMETGTGKTYCYIKTMFELNREYGWSKFIVVVPSIAIREGVALSLEIMGEHFLEQYGKRVRWFVYNSKQLHNLESFSSDAGINVMIINVQAFAARGEDARRIYLELDDFQSRRPIDVIKKNRPVLILDEPQKMEGRTTTEKLAEFEPLMVLRYSATHRTEHNKIYRLDAIDAYNQKLVKKIAVRGIAVKGLSGTNAYLYFEGIKIATTKPPEARAELEIQQKSGIKRVLRTLRKNDNLYELSDGLDQYRGFVVSDINAIDNTISFTNGVVLNVGDATGDVTEAALRRIQIREAIKAHFEKERTLFGKGVKVLTLFFIDEVAKYRSYDETGEQAGEYSRMFEEEYDAQYNQIVTLDDTPYHRYLKGIPAAKTHNGYFSIDKRTKRLVDPAVRARGEGAGEADDADAYDLILRDKARLLSLDEPVRFIFSHSALREGWDNPNVFVICTLKHSDNTISRRQEVGRGMRLAVDQRGDRQDDPATVHQLNVLMVVANESYKDFVAGLQRDISATLSARPRKANEEYFNGKVLATPGGEVVLTPPLAKALERYLVKNDYTDNDDRITASYHEARKNGTLAALPAELAVYAEEVFQLVDTVFSDAQLPAIEDDRRARVNPLNDNFKKKEFQELWARINRKSIYAVDFSSQELIEKCIGVLNAGLNVAPLQYTVVAGEQRDVATFEDVTRGEGFAQRGSVTESLTRSAGSAVRYDLIGKLAEVTQLTRRTIAAVLAGLSPAKFKLFAVNPEDFILKVGVAINEQKATAIVEHIAYDPLDETHSIDIFAEQKREDLAKGFKAERHIYDYVFTESSNERTFVGELDSSAEVVVYAKLPKAFSIPTPVGNYSPDWAIAFHAGRVKHIYFVAETKGSMSSLDLRKIEEAKIDCARKFFARISSGQVRYEVVNGYGKLMELVS
jgi:type III restriction enzyme